MPVVSKAEPVELEIPHERGSFITFRMVNGAVLDEARTKGLRAIADIMKIAGDAKELIEQSRSAATAIAAATSPDQIAKQEHDSRINPEAYDKDTLLTAGVIAWRGKGYEIECNEETRLDLDDATRLWATRTILELSIISLGEVPSSASSGAANGAELSPAASS